MKKQANNPPLDEGRRDTPLKVRWLGLAAGAAISLAPVCAYAGDQSPYSVPLRAPPANGYLYPGASFISALARHGFGHPEGAAQLDDTAGDGHAAPRTRI